MHIPDASIDMVMCDLPYGTTQNKWDVVIPFEVLWEQYVRLVRLGGALVFTASQPFASLLVGSNISWFKHEWIWKKTTATGHLNAKVMPMKLHENILVFANGKCPFYPQGLQPYNKITRRGSNGGNFGHAGIENFQQYTNYPRSILEFALDREKLHPTQKPVGLMEYMINTYSKQDETVLDNCMGSGSTGVACAMTGRKFIGIEKDPKYFRMAKARIEEAFGL